MDLISKWNQMIRDEAGFFVREPGTPVPDQVQDLLQDYLRLWWACEGGFPAFGSAYTETTRNENGELLADMVAGLAYELKHIPGTVEAQKVQANRLKSAGQKLAGRLLNLEPRHFEFIEASGLLTASQKFARQARAFDSRLSAEDIYQAGRNVMTMNFIQLLLNLPVEITPSVFAYSLLYPYTDNYLDDPAVSRTTKLAFNHRFQQRLAGEKVKTANPQEAVISDLVGMIEEEWPRGRFQRVHDSLMAIHTAQVRSLSMVAPYASPYELDVLGVSFEKGGTSVLADGYLVAGNLTQEQAELMFGYGAFTQLMDDLEDVPADLGCGQMTIFSQTAHGWTLDNLTNRVFHFGRAVFSDLSAFPSPAAGMLKEVIERCIDPLLIDSIGRISHLYSKDYLRRIEQHFPVRFAHMRRQRERLIRQKITLSPLLEKFVLSQQA